jgi:hypothetical protein
MGLRVPLALAVALVSLACGGSAPTPTNPTPIATPSPTATPVPSTRVCEPWPSELAEMMSKLSLPAGLCLTMPLTAGLPSQYVGLTRTVVINEIAPPPAGLLGTIAHELGHAHQNRVILDAGFRDTNNILDAWITTDEGKDWTIAAGWETDGHIWIEHCEGITCGYPAPHEDSAQWTAIWYLPALFNVTPDLIRVRAPNRAKWLTKYLPR